MQKLILMGCLLLSLIIAPIDAQDGTYYLRQPSATEYLQVIGKHLSENQALTVEGDVRNDTVSALSISILHLFSADDTATFEGLYEAYQRLNIGYLDGVYRGEWNVLLVRWWLDENQPDLSDVDELELAPEFVVHVTPHDFNADRRNEYVLDVFNVDSVHMYLVAVPESTGYRVIDPGLPWTGYTPWGRYSEGEGQITEYDFRDINADGLPEWLVLLYDVTSGGPGMGYSDGGELLILGWRKNTLDYLAYTRLDAPEGVAWEHLLTFTDAETLGDTLPATVQFGFHSIDDDPALEILQSKPTSNNWGCRRVETKRFDWDADAELLSFTPLSGTKRCPNGTGVQTAPG